MRLVLLALLMIGCTRSNVTIYKSDIGTGKATGISVTCKKAVMWGECGYNYTGCSDGIDHGCGAADMSGIWLEK